MNPWTLGFGRRPAKVGKYLRPVEKSPQREIWERLEPRRVWPVYSKRAPRWYSLFVVSAARRRRNNKKRRFTVPGSEDCETRTPSLPPGFRRIRVKHLSRR